MVQLKKFSIREEVMVEYNGYWYPAVIIEPKPRVIINDDDYWVHYVGWNKKYDDIVHVEIIRAKSDVLPEVNRNEKGKSKRSKEIMKELEPKKKLDDPGFKSSKSAKKPAPTKRKAASTASATPPVSKRSKINTPVTTSKRHRTSSTAQLVENGFDDVENGSRTSGRLGLKSAKSPMPKIKWATQKKDMIATMKSNGVDKDAIDEIVRKWSHDINKAINRITQKHIGNQSEYRGSYIKIEPDDSDMDDITNYADFVTTIPA